MRTLGKDGNAAQASSSAVTISPASARSSQSGLTRSQRIEIH